jgi:hypothetical protein
MFLQRLCRFCPSLLIIFYSVSFGRTNNSTYYFTNMLMKAFVTSSTNETNAFNDIAQNNGEDFWKVYF